MNLLSCLLPDTTHVRLETCSPEPAQSAITVTLHARQTAARCPLCSKRSKRVHSRYERTLADLPCVQRLDSVLPLRLRKTGHLITKWRDCHCTFEFGGVNHDGKSCAKRERCFAGSLVCCGLRKRRNREDINIV